ncbi:unnamed protein product [Pleuronectes platessa]|uniref:Uncharacterized protein n=1 Tax=Pleuronectes platessa TaxID=8262 RepID=A0A9N7VQQ6_PLEPL|nr:unnamed protein product [Pleuronectes platessa]
MSLVVVSVVEESSVSQRGKEEEEMEEERRRGRRKRIRKRGDEDSLDLQLKDGHRLNPSAPGKMKSVCPRSSGDSVDHWTHDLCPTCPSPSPTFTGHTAEEEITSGNPIFKFKWRSSGLNIEQLLFNMQIIPFMKSLIIKSGNKKNGPG